MANSTPKQQKEYGALEIVPKEGKHMSYLSYALTWAGGALQPTVWTLGGTLVCMGFLKGSLALILAGIISGIIIGVIGNIGYQTGMSSSALFRAVLGVRGSKITSVTALINYCGWVAIGCYIAAISISYIANALFGLPAYGSAGSEMTMVLGCFLICVLSYLGIVIGGSKTLKLFETIMMAALIIFSIVILAALLSGLSWSDVISFRVPEEMAMNFPTGFNMMFIVCVTFATLVCDYSRYVKSRATALTGNIVGAIPALYAFCAMGMLGPIAAYVATGVFSLDDANPSSLCMALGLGIPLLFVIVFSVITTDMLDFYSSGLSLQNVFPKLKYRTAVSIAAVVCFALSMIPVFVSSFYAVFYAFLDVLGAIFPPLYTILIVDFYFVHKRKYSTDELENENGVYWFTKGFNLCAIISWVIGTAIFSLFNAFRVGANSVGYAIPAFLVTGIVYYVLGTLAVHKGYYQLTDAKAISSEKE